MGLLLLGAPLVGTASAAPPTVVTCGSTITQSTRLANDVGPCPGDGINIGASNITLDLAGHSVFGMPLNQYGTTSDEAVGIHFLQTTGSKVENGSVYHFAVGVLVDGGSANTVRRINAHDNVGPVGVYQYGDGISVWGSSQNTVEDNVAARNGPFSGISLVNPVQLAANPSAVPNPSATAPDDNTVVRNQVLDNNTEQLCDPSTGCTDAFGTPEWNSDFGIRVEGPDAIHNVVQNNYVYNSGSVGINIEPSCKNPFTNNGPDCTGDIPNEYNSVIGNESDHNGYASPGPGGTGISLFAMGGYAVLQPTHETVVRNTTKDNHNDGIRLQGGSCNGQAPKVPPGTPPISCSATYNTVDRNVSNGNGHDGIFLGRGADHNTLDHNTADANTRDGISLNVGMNSSGPIPLSGPMDNTLTHNVGLNNKVWDGYDGTPGCDNNDWDNNVFMTANQPCVLANDSQSGADVTPGTSQADTGNQSGSHLTKRDF